MIQAKQIDSDLVLVGRKLDFGDQRAIASLTSDQERAVGKMLGEVAWINFARGREKAARSSMIRAVIVSAITALIVAYLMKGGL